MTVDKAINENDLIKAKMKADFIRRYEKAKEDGFRGDMEDFIRRIKYLGLRKGGPVKPNGVTTISLDEWLEGIDPGGWSSEEDKPMKVAYKYGTTSQAEEDLVVREIDNWTNAINKGELDPSTSFMQYLDMILGRQGINRGGIVSIVPTL
tara:strand:- start:1958 stop:2407 length:450 start_codon:yes stop_codon:yes gene_type:complete